VTEKWSKKDHPAYQAGYRKNEAEPASEETQPQISFQVNDTVLARWKTGDGSFYPARITSITGSASKPVYIVTFKSYSTTETLSAKDIKAVAGESSKKRKADGTPGAVVPSLLPAPPFNPNVISAAANVDPALASQARQEPSKVSDGPARPAKLPRKVKAGKELEAGKSKWQDFSSKGKLSKVAKKESMFRTPDGVNARGMFLRFFFTPPPLFFLLLLFLSRLLLKFADLPFLVVGFTGSGQQMRKDPARSRHIYNQGNEEDA
jgi:survival of motor neuron-related-splicing factor 30